MGADLYTKLAQTVKAALVAAVLALGLWTPDETMAKFIQIIPGQRDVADSPTFTGTVTFPDGSTWTTAGEFTAATSQLGWSDVTLLRGGTDMLVLSTPNEPLLVLRDTVNSRLAMGYVAANVPQVTNNLLQAQIVVDNFGKLHIAPRTNINVGIGFYTTAAAVAIERWQLPSAGHFQPKTSNVLDLGASDNLVRSGYFGTLVQSLDYLAVHGSDDTTAPQIYARKSRGAVAAPTVITTGDDLLDIVANGYVGATNTWQEACRIKADSTGTISDSATGIAGIWRFLAAKTGAEPAEIVQVNGTDQHLLHVGAEPSITAGGGTNPGIDGTDEAFTVTVGSGGIATSVEVTFANAFAVAPRCCANHQGAILILRCVSTVTKVTIDAATPFTAGGLIDVICRSGTT